MKINHIYSMTHTRHVMVITESDDAYTMLAVENPEVGAQVTRYDSSPVTCQSVTDGEYPDQSDNSLIGSIYDIAGRNVLVVTIGGDAYTMLAAEQPEVGAPVARYDSYPVVAPNGDKLSEGAVTGAAGWLAKTALKYGLPAAALAGMVTVGADREHYDTYKGKPDTRNVSQPYVKYDANDKATAVKTSVRPKARPDALNTGSDSAVKTSVRPKARPEGLAPAQYESNDEPKDATDIGSLVAAYTSGTQSDTDTKRFKHLVDVYFNALENAPAGVVGVGAITYAEQKMMDAQQHKHAPSKLSEHAIKWIGAGLNEGKK